MINIHFHCNLFWTSPPNKMAVYENKSRMFKRLCTSKHSLYQTNRYGHDLWKITVYLSAVLEITSSFASTVLEIDFEEKCVFFKFLRPHFNDIYFFHSRDKIQLKMKIFRVHMCMSQEMPKEKKIRLTKKTFNCRNRWIHRIDHTSNSR